MIISFWKQRLAYIQTQPLFTLQIIEPSVATIIPNCVFLLEITPKSIK